MLVASICNRFQGIGLLDYAYLALNVYHDQKDKALLGQLPYATTQLALFAQEMRYHNSWYQIAFPYLNMPFDWGFYAELYAKVYHGKIQHLMVAFRGTDSKVDWVEDVLNWGSSVLKGTDHHASLPHYWHYASVFIMKCCHVIRLLDHYHLLAPFVGQHITGHSLGGALANLVAAQGTICQPPGIKSVLPVTPNIISFNAPGIGDMKNACESPFCEAQVISMRAQYDMVSAVGVPYGYVINNVIPEGYDKAKEAFAIEHAKEGAGPFVQKPNLGGATTQQGCDATPLCDSKERYDQIDKDGEAIKAQHSMDNFLRVILNDHDTLAVSFDRLRLWAQTHGGKNHDFKSPAMLGIHASAMAV